MFQLLKLNSLKKKKITKSLLSLDVGLNSEDISDDSMEEDDDFWDKLLKMNKEESVKSSS